MSTYLQAEAQSHQCWQMPSILQTAHHSEEHLRCTGREAPWEHPQDEKFGPEREEINIREIRNSALHTKKSLISIPMIRLIRIKPGIRNQL